MDEKAAGTLMQTAEPDFDLPKLDGRVIGGRYALHTAIGAGGMGTVWSGHDQLLRRDVAVKEVLIHDGLPEREREMLCERTLREARAAARLDHSSVIRVYDVVNDNDRPWIVMELLEARSLADVIKEDGGLGVERVAEIGLSVLSALEAAHRIGILHRDVKPGNVLLCANGRIVLTDFGVARSPDETPLTSTGLLLGSPQYIAPERARGRLFGPPSDLFSLGAALYAGVEARPPFDRGDPIPTMTAVVCEPPDPMPHAGPLQEVLLGLLEKDPEQRWDAKRAKLALRAIVRTARRANGSTGESTTSLRLRTVDNPNETTAERVGRHRRADPKLLSVLARPLVSAAEATAAIVVSRGKHSKRSKNETTRVGDVPAQRGPAQQNRVDPVKDTNHGATKNGPGRSANARATQSGPSARYRDNSRLAGGSSAPDRPPTRSSRRTASRHSALEEGWDLLRTPVAGWIYAGAVGILLLIAAIVFFT